VSLAAVRMKIQLLGYYQYIYFIFWLGILSAIAARNFL